MLNALHCTCSQNPPLFFPSFLISFDITQSLLLDLALCNLLSSLLIGVECNSFCSSVHLHYHKSYLSLFLLVVHHSWSLLFGDGSMDLGSVAASFFQHFSCPGSFLFLPSPSHSHVCYLWLIVMSIFLHFCSTLTLLIDVSLFSVDSLGQTHFSPFPLHSNGTALGKHGSLLLIIKRVW